MRQLKGDRAFPKGQFKTVTKLPDKLVPISHGLKDRYLKGAKQEKSEFLDKDEYASAYVRLARAMKDDAVFGKPEFDLIYKGLKPHDIDVEFGNVKNKPFRCILE